VLEQHWQTFFGELQQLDRDEFMRWPKPETYSGTWLAFPLIAGRYLGALDVDLEHNRRRCPDSYRILASMKGIELSGFSRLEPGCHVLPHEDLKEDEILRCHLGLDIPPRAFVSVAGERRTWQQGKCLLFDGRILHETKNEDTVPRTILLTDVWLDQWGCMDALYGG
jgi:beta-hydroxylase